MLEDRPHLARKGESRPCADTMETMWAKSRFLLAEAHPRKRREALLTKKRVKVRRACMPGHASNYICYAVGTE